MQLLASAPFVLHGVISFNPIVVDILNQDKDEETLRRLNCS